MKVVHKINLLTQFFSTFLFVSHLNPIFRFSFECCQLLQYFPTCTAYHHTGVLAVLPSFHTAVGHVAPFIVSFFSASEPSFYASLCTMKGPFHNGLSDVLPQTGMAWHSVTMFCYKTLFKNHWQLLTWYFVLMCVHRCRRTVCKGKKKQCLKSCDAFFSINIEFFIKCFPLIMKSVLLGFIVCLCLFFHNMLTFISWVLVVYSSLYTP